METFNGSRYMGDAVIGERRVQFRRIDSDFAGYKAALQAKSMPISPFIEEREPNPCGGP